MKSSSAVTGPVFSLRNVASTSGRLDVICRSILSAFLVDGVIRRDVVFYGSLWGPPEPPKLLTVTGSALRFLPNDEVYVARVIRELFLDGDVPDGFKVERKSFDDLIYSIRRMGVKLFYLHEEGLLIKGVDFDVEGDYGFILGDQLGLDVKSERLLSSLGIRRISLGPVSYLASQCILIVNNHLDRL